MRVLMVAAENDVLPGAKVGGIADVVRDLPPALAAQTNRQGEHHCVDVVVPSYGVLHELAGASKVAEFDVAFRDDSLRVSCWQIESNATDCDAGSTSKVRQFVLHCAAFAPGKRGQVYCDDPPQRPFASDANKFALFSAAVCKAIVNDAFGRIDVIHLHDWHAALVLLLRAVEPEYAALKRIRCVFTIHNLALQGVRPLRGDPSSLVHWFPDLAYTRAQVVDPRWDDCINPMAVGIRLADAVNTVSPSYAEDILKPNAIEDSGFHGGEGLETDLNAARDEGRLFGVLNGCEYPVVQGKAAPRPSWPRLTSLLREEILALIAADETLASAHFIASRRVQELGRKRPAMVLTSIGRIVEQKLGLMRQPVSTQVTDSGGGSALEAMLKTLGERGLFVLLGSGDAQLEGWLRQVAARHENFLFVRGYSPRLGDALYRAGDLFLMPSSYEPCGISQMLAMRAGQPCLVHGVGGLRDTVKHERNGFSFNAANKRAQARAMLRTFKAALELHENEPAAFKQIAKAASSSRFRWDDSAQVYLRDIYRAAAFEAQADKASTIRESA